jgi:hypothetical protein
MNRLIHDPEPMAPYPVHTVEVGDNYLTLWLRGNDCECWAREVGLPDFHDRDVFHTNTPKGWLTAYAPPSAGDWNKHRHVFLGRVAEPKDLERFKSGMSDELYRASRELLRRE